MSDLIIEIVGEDAIVLEVGIVGLQGPPGLAPDANALATVLAGADTTGASSLALALAHVASAGAPAQRQALQLAFSALLAETFVTLADLVLDHSSVALTAAPGSMVGILSQRAVGSTLSLSPEDGRFAVVGNALVRGSAPLAAGPAAIMITETLGSALNSPHTTALTIAVTALPVLTQIASSAVLPLNRQLSTSTSNNRATAKFFRNGRKAVANVRLLYANTYLGSTGGEASDIGNLRVWGAVRLAGETGLHQATFDGATSKLLAPGETILSDPLPGLVIAATGGFFVVTADQCAVGDYRPTQYYLATSRG